MKKALVLSVLTVLLGSAVAWAGVTLGWSMFGSEFVPFGVGAQYDGQYGVGFGVEAAYFDMFEGLDFMGRYSLEAFATIDLADWVSAQIGFMPLFDLVDLAPGLGVTTTYCGTVGILVGQYGSSVFVKAVYPFDGSDALTIQYGVKVDLFGVVRLVQERLAEADTSGAGGDE